MAELKHGALLAAALIPLLSLSGCTTLLEKINEHPTPEPLTLTGLTIKQVQRSGPPPGIYQGSIFFPYCGYNPNSFDIKVQGSFDVYQIRGSPGNEYLHPIQIGEATPRTAFAHDIIRGGQSYIHAVLANETAEGGFNYTIHLWHEILNPEPIHRWDFWYNVTFIPYQEEVYYEEGEPCWLG